MFLSVVRLSTCDRNAEIGRLLPLLGPFIMEFKALKQNIDKAFKNMNNIDKSERNIPKHNITMKNNVYQADEKAVATITGPSKYF